MNHTIIPTLPCHQYTVSAAEGTPVIDTQSGQSLCIVSSAAQGKFFAIGYSVRIGDSAANIEDISYSTSVFKPKHVEQRILPLPAESQLFLEPGAVHDMGVIRGDFIDLRTLKVSHQASSSASTELWLRTTENIPSLLWPDATHWVNSSRAPELECNHFYCFTIRSAQEVLVMNISYSYPL